VRILKKGNYKLPFAQKPLPVKKSKQAVKRTSAVYYFLAVVLACIVLIATPVFTASFTCRAMLLATIIFLYFADPWFHFKEALSV
jgi:hypothetical protein